MFTKGTSKVFTIRIMIWLICYSVANSLVGEMISASSIAGKIIMRIIYCVSFILVCIVPLFKDLNLNRSTEEGTPAARALAAASRKDLETRLRVESTRQKYTKDINHCVEATSYSWQWESAYSFNSILLMESRPGQCSHYYRATFAPDANDRVACLHAEINGKDVMIINRPYICQAEINANATATA